MSLEDIILIIGIPILVVWEIIKLIWIAKIIFRDDD